MEEPGESSKKPTVLVVDDTPDNIALMSSLLNTAYRTKIALDGEKALQVAFSNDSLDLILLDIMMPGMDGYEVCRRLKANPKTTDIPVIFLTAMTGEKDEQMGLELGAVDYITKPISPPIILSRVRTHLQLKSARDFLKNKSEYLEKEVARRTREVLTIQDVTMVAIGSLAETRDNETGNHIRRTQYYVVALARHLQEPPRYKDFLTSDTIELLQKSVPLHDIGKVGIPDSILLKPGKLTAAEFEIMKTHTILGRNAIMAAEKLLDSPTSFLRLARATAYTHHEKWDGTGYLQGLVAENIPLAGRLMAVADVYDALISKRVYKPAFTHEKAVSIIREGSGTHFDPHIVEAFLKISDEFNDIARKYSDPEGSRI